MDMSSISQVAQAMQRVLTTHAKHVERETGFVQRSTVQLDGPSFAQMTVFGWMDNPEASYPQLRHVAASLDVKVEYAGGGAALRSAVSRVAAGAVAGGGGGSAVQPGERAGVAQPLQ